MYIERKGSLAGKSLLYCFDVDGAVSHLQTFWTFLYKYVHSLYFKTWTESMRLFLIFVVDYKFTEKSKITYEEIEPD